MLRKDLATKALRDASLSNRLSRVHTREEVEAAIRAALSPLEADEEASAKAIEGLFGSRDACVRYRREGGEFLFSVIDLAMVAKGCDYEAAQKLVWRLAEEYFDERLGDDDPAENQTTCLIFRRIIFDGQRGRPTPCLAVDKAIEFLMLIPGSEISAAVRREAAQCLVRVAGGDESLITAIEENSKLQEYLRAHDPGHPLRAAGEFAEKRRLDDEARDERLEKRLCAAFERQMASVVDARLGAAVGEMRVQLQAIVSALPSMMHVPAHVSLNSSSRSTAQLSRANVPPPRNDAERRDLVEGTLLVSAYLRDKIAEVYPRLSDQRRRSLLSAIKTAFSNALENLKLERSSSVARVAQIARSQPHYTHDDRPLMDEAWAALAPYRGERCRRLAPVRRPAAA